MGSSNMRGALQVRERREAETPAQRLQRLVAHVQAGPTLAKAHLARSPSGTQRP
jgi:hypothetical protein